jgi:hypothetical protein
MKKLLALVVAATLCSVSVAAETKRVCTTQKDAKTGKEKEVCKNVKVHKKHEGTAVPEKAPAKKPAGKPEPKK